MPPRGQRYTPQVVKRVLYGVALFRGGKPRTLCSEQQDNAATLILLLSLSLSPYLQISVDLGIPDVLVDPKIGYEPQEAEVDIRVQCIREKVAHQRALELQSRERCWMTIMTYY